ncbi:MAG: hypothetical protein ACI4F7_08785 [Acutalibacteraceae bacterium]
MNKPLLKQLLRAVCFTSLLTSILFTVSVMLEPKDNTRRSGITHADLYGFLSEPENTVDIAVIGNSDAGNGFSPLELWNKYGYTSYVCAEPWQTVPQGYSVLKKFLRFQKPKLVVLETDGVFDRINPAKAAAYIAEPTRGGLISLIDYHNRWKTAKLKELFQKPIYTYHSFSKGQWLDNGVKGYTGGEYMKKCREKEKIPLSARLALDLFVKTCRENKIGLLFAELPSQSSWSYKKHNAVADYADKNGIPFLDLNIDRESFGFDWKTDTRDGGNHLNNRGAKKSTLFIGEYISKNCSIPDRRQDKRFKRWNEDYEHYLKSVQL